MARSLSRGGGRRGDVRERQPHSATPRPIVQPGDPRDAGQRYRPRTRIPPPGG